MSKACQAYRKRVKLFISANASNACFLADRKDDAGGYGGDTEGSIFDPTVLIKKKDHGSWIKDHGPWIKDQGSWTLDLVVA